MGTSLSVITDLTKTHRVFEVMKILEFCGSTWLNTAEHLDLLFRERAAGNYAPCQPWRLQKGQTWGISGVLIPLVTQLTNLKVLVVD